MATYSLGRRRVIALLFLSSILLITLDIRGSAAIDRLRSGFALVLDPFDTAARTVTRPVVNAWRGMTEYGDLIRENERLRERLAQQRGAAIEAQAAIMEYQDLLELRGLIGLGYPNVQAQVQGASPSNFQYTVEISKGSSDGIRVGMPVVNGAGLVGKITQVFPDSSIVLLITDPEFSVGAKILTSRVVAPVVTTVPDESSTIPGGLIDPNPSTTTTLPGDTSAAPGTTLADSPATGTTTTTTDPSALPGTLTTDLLTSQSPDDTGTLLDGDSSGTDIPTTATTTTLPTVEVIRETGTLRGQGADRPLVLDFIEQSTTANNLEAGSTVETAGGANSIAPAGLPIGLVSRVSKQPGSNVPIVEVESAAGDLSRLTFVTVLLYLPNTSS